MALPLSPLALRRRDDSERVGALERENAELKAENKGLKRKLKTAMQGVEAVLKAARRQGAETSSDDEESAPDDEALLSELGKVCLCISVGVADAPAAQIPLADFIADDVAATRSNTGRFPGPTTPAKKIFLRVKVCKPSTEGELSQRLPMDREATAHPWYGEVLTKMRAAAPHFANVLASNDFKNDAAKFAQTLDGVAAKEGPSGPTTIKGKEFRVLLNGFPLWTSNNK